VVIIKGRNLETTMNFTKMHGIGNDYVYVDCFKDEVADPMGLAPLVSDRHTGIGADGLILIGPSYKADVKMRMFNADGSEAQMCGNGIRCVAKYAFDHKLASSRGRWQVPKGQLFPASLQIETGRGVLSLGLSLGEDGKVSRVCVNMGEPHLAAAEIPVKLPVKEAIEQPMQFKGHAFVMTCVSMGNPHAVFFRDDISRKALEEFGPIIERHSIFPQRTNVHFVRMESRSVLHMSTWERGSGITLACGTGACACAVAAVLTNRCDRTVTAHLPGGNLELFWCEQDNCVYMTGPAVEVYSGTWPE
jgi:diaminopimelate epimerase